MQLRKIRTSPPPTHKTIAVTTEITCQTNNIEEEGKGGALHVLTNRSNNYFTDCSSTQNIGNTIEFPNFSCVKLFVYEMNTK